MLPLFAPSLLSPCFPLGKADKLFQEQERLVIKHVFFTAPSQRQIVELTKIPQQTVSRMVKALLEKEVFLQISKASDGTRGQPGYQLQCNPEFAYSVGIGILTNSVSLALMNFRGEVMATLEKPLSSMSVANVMDNLRVLYRQLLDEAQIDTARLLGIGVGISGYFTHDSHRINTHSLLNEWAGIDIPELIAGEFNCPVWVENDATAAAAGEGIVGIGKEINNFVYLFISTAFGGGIVMNGELLRGTHGNAGELGELLPPKIFIHPNLENLRQILIKNQVEIQTIDQLITQFDAQWPGVNEWIYKVKDALSLVASSAAAILDTQAIVLGGHIPKPLAALLADEIEIYGQHRRDVSRPKPAMLVARTDSDPVAIGAASLPFRELCL